MDLAHSLGAKGSGGDGLLVLGLIELDDQSFNDRSSKLDVGLHHHFFLDKKAHPQQSRHLLFGGKV